MKTTYNAVYTFYTLLGLDTQNIPSIYQTVCTIREHRSESDVNLVIEYAAKEAQSLVLQKDSRAFTHPVETKSYSSVLEHPNFQGEIAKHAPKFEEQFKSLSAPAQFVLFIQSFSSISNESIAHILKCKEIEISQFEQEIIDTMGNTVFDYFKQYVFDKNMPESLLKECQKFEPKKNPTKNKWILPILIVCLLLVGGVFYFNQHNATQNNVESTKLSIDMNKTYYADIKVKKYGTITVRLDQKEAPVTVDNFVKLAKDHFYDGLTFHRIMEGFMIQGGDPNGDGSGGSDHNIVGEFENNDHENNISHVRGTISMARSQMPDSASSQFFIVHEDSTFLDGDYAGFGTVTKGMEVVDKIAKKAKPTDDNGSIKKKDQPVIESIKIYTKE